jgi:hypothetical protein
MVLYFDIIPEDIIYLIINKLSYTNFINFKKTVNISLNYEYLFSIKFYNLYKEVKYIQNYYDDIYSKYKDTLYQILYLDILEYIEFEKEDMKYEENDIYYGDVNFYYDIEDVKNTLNSITVITLQLLTISKYIPKVMNRIKLYPRDNNAAYVYYTYLYKSYLDDDEILNTKERYENLKRYITGEEEFINFYMNILDDITLNPIVILQLLYILLKENQISKITFDLVIKYRVINIIKWNIEPREDPYYYGIYKKYERLFDLMRSYILENIDKIKFI